MAFTTIANLKTDLGLGSRANLFEVTLQFPTAIAGWEGPDAAAVKDINILVKAAQIPGFTVGVIEVPYKAGRRIKIPGDRTFADWTVTVINDENHNARRAFTAWIDLISKGNYNSATKSVATDYYTDLYVSQLRGNGFTQRIYKLNDAFPTDVSAVDLSMDSTDTLSEFTVNFQYQWLKVGTTKTEVDTDKYDTTIAGTALA